MFWRKKVNPFKWPTKKTRSPGKKMVTCFTTRGAVWQTISKFQQTIAYSVLHEGRMVSTGQSLYPGPSERLDLTNGGVRNPNAQGLCQNTTSAPAWCPGLIRLSHLHRCPRSHQEQDQNHAEIGLRLSGYSLLHSQDIGIKSGLVRTCRNPPRFSDSGHVRYSKIPAARLRRSGCARRRVIAVPWLRSFGSPSAAASADQCVSNRLQECKSAW